MVTNMTQLESSNNKYYALTFRYIYIYKYRCIIVCNSTYATIIYLKKCTCSYGPTLILYGLSFLTHLSPTATTQ